MLSFMSFIFYVIEIQHAHIFLNVTCVNAFFFLFLEGTQISETLVFQTFSRGRL